MRLRRVAWHLALALTFCGVYVTCYVYFLNKWFAYAGFVMYARDGSFWAVSIVLATLPIVCYNGYRAVSSAVAVFLYLLLYVPIVLTFAFGSQRQPGEIILVQSVLMVCMCALFFADRIVVRTPVDLRIGVDLVPWIFALTVASIAFIFVAYRGHLRLVSFGADVYVQRAESDEIGIGLIGRYTSSWMNSILIPICLAYGLVARKRKYFIAGFVGCVLMYLAVAAKIAILLPGIYAALFFFLRRGRLNAIFPVMVIGLSVVLLSLLAITNEWGGLPFVASSLLMNRTIGNAGQLTLAYFDFFQSHPQTLYTHVHGIREITGAYPYGGKELGEVVGQFYFDGETNANANFWATDGFAALGLSGLFFSTAAVFLLLMVLNSVTRSYDKLFTFLCLVPLLLWLLNTSLFTAIWSGGALFLTLFFLCNERRPGRGSDAIFQGFHAPASAVGVTS